MSENIETIRHSLGHIMTHAIEELFGKAGLGVGPAISDGWYQDFDLGEKAISSDDFSAIKKKMQEIINKNLDFTQKIVTAKEAREMAKDDPYKLEIIDDLAQNGEKEFSFYTIANFVNLCAGPHVANTKELRNIGWQLDRLAGAYWKGDAKNKQMTRVYGLAFANKEELNAYLQKREEAQKRDHRKLGKELDLFHIDENVGLGLPLWHPKGAIIWRVIEDFWYQAHFRGGYDLVRSPHIGSKTLWQTSGHWGFYNSSMYPPLEVGQSLEERQENKKVESSEEYLLKPMNCPFHICIYKNKPHSYREFPMRWAECGTVYRFEKRGELSGLTRARGFTQDDAHIICRKDQAEDELKEVLDFILYIFKSFGFDTNSIKVYLSLRDPKNKEKYVGSDEGWKFTESILRKIAIEKKLNFIEEEGEAAFYGPKLDFKINDCLGREWQCSTLQYDFNLPERFDMTFVNKDNKEERPYVLHNALFGSFERFIGLLIEHYAGAFPTWLAPVQTVILPISEKHSEFAQIVRKELFDLSVRSEIYEADETLGKRIREAEKQKVPYMLIIGDQEIQNKSVTIRKRGQTEQENMPLPAFAAKLKKEIDDKI
ncbi:MAG: threonine--tRNA ligase [Patescibacteria group bacterium]|nr:threonine--tRNA ligase [Patescibacteria group bacterium]